MGRPSSLIESAEQIILNTIVLAGKEGIAKKDLLQKVFPLDQSTVYRISKKLKEQGLIKIIRYGQRTRYFAVNSSRRNVGLGAYLLGNRFVGNYSLLGKEGLVLSDHVQEYPKFIDFATYRQFFEPKFNTNSSLEKTVFEYSNQVGAFVTYLFIHAMNAENINALLLLQKDLKKKKEKSIVESKNHMRFVTEEWIRNSICSNIIQMLWKFNHMIRPYGYIPDILSDEGLKERKQLGPYLLEKKSITELLNAFSHVYPRLYHELESLRTGLSEEVTSYKEFEQTIHEKIDIQNKCSHEFSRPRVLAIRDDNRRKIMIKRCIKCGYKERFEKRSWPS
jgi:hypothetical protein